MVNNAFRHYVIEHQGLAAWNDVVVQAELEASEFAAMMAYDDQVTMTVVKTIAANADREIEDLLRDVGRSWVDFAKTTSFAGLLAMAGQDFETLVGNLNSMHAKIKTSLPTIRPPSFACHQRADGFLDITYSSEREGLFPFVEGILEGLAAHFGRTIGSLDFEQLSPCSARWTLKLDARADEAA